MSAGERDSPVGETVRRLKQLLARLERSAGRAERVQVATGCGPLDGLLPEGGLVRGSLVEWLGDGPGHGAGTLALAAAVEACREGGVLVVVDRDGTFYPPAAAAWRIDLQRTIVVRPQNDRDEHWALDQSLRCEHAAAVLAWPRRLDGHSFRRLQLAAEGSGCLGLLIRPGTARDEPSWADVRLLISPRASQQGWRLRVRLLRCRGGFGEREVELEINDRTGEFHEAHPDHLASQLARAAAGERSA